MYEFFRQSAGRTGSSLKRFRRESGGQIALMFATVLPALLMAVGLTVDYVMVSKHRTQLQSAADAAAIASARELTVANADVDTIQAVADSFAKYNLKDGTAGITVSTAVGADFSDVSVAIEKKWTPLFAKLFDASITPIHVEAKARLAGGDKICVLSLDSTALNTINLQQSSTLQANGCSVFANSTSSGALSVGRTASMSAQTICSSGGYSGSSSSYTPQPITDCPVTPDPIEKRKPPSYGSCDYQDRIIDNGNVNIQPGVYCGGLTITLTANVTAEAGSYIIKDGELEVSGSASLTGENVAFFLTGATSKLLFTRDSSVSLTGAETGDMAGLLFFEDRNNSAGEKHMVASTNARKLVGTIYLPKGDFVVQSDANIGADSAYTAIIARRVMLNQSPSVVLNSNYGATAVPVPAGIVGGRVVLSQ